MLDFNFSPEITKDKILSLVTEKDIVEHYVKQKITSKEQYMSPLREEKSPSFTFKQYGNKIIWRDWGTGLFGDAFTLVCKLYDCNFHEALHRIDNDLHLGLTNRYLPSKPIEKKIDVGDNDYTVKRHIILVEKQPYTLADYNYWRQYGISLRTLMEYDVKSCRYVWLDEKLIRQYKNSNPVYAYKFKDEDHIYYKIYCPLEVKRRKWVFNGSANCYEGYDQLPLHGEVLIITKSMKDIMCLHDIGYPAISLQGESNKLTQEFYEKLCRRFGKLVLLYDNDEAGRNGSSKISNKFGIRELFIPDDKYKDISDYTKAFGTKESEKLIKQLLYE